MSLTHRHVVHVAARVRLLGRTTSGSPVSARGLAFAPHDVSAGVRLACTHRPGSVDSG
jgi:hypothetical protein